MQLVAQHVEPNVAPCEATFTRPNPVEKASVAICSVNGRFLTQNACTITRATHVRNRVCQRVELILKIIIILLIIFLGFIKSKPC